MSLKIRTARLHAGISQQDVAASVGRTAMWVSYVENGRLTASPEMERTILTAIARLAQLKETVRASKEALAEELKDERAVGASIR